jgi:hypothetical protein
MEKRCEHVSVCARMFLCRRQYKCVYTIYEETERAAWSKIVLLVRQSKSKAKHTQRGPAVAISGGGSLHRARRGAHRQQHRRASAGRHYQFKTPLIPRRGVRGIKRVRCGCAPRECFAFVVCRARSLFPPLIGASASCGVCRSLIVISVSVISNSTVQCPVCCWIIPVRAAAARHLRYLHR